MALSLHNLKPARGSKRKSKHLGRGNASGTGTYAGRGMKGQRARSGVSNLKRLGMKQVLLRTPKVRGFRSLEAKAEAVSLADLNAFAEGARIDVKSLYKNGLVSAPTVSAKILANGNLKVKGLVLRGIKVSEKAKEAIEKLSGKVLSAQSKR
jgi:large subunit ribosomal protein L15